MVVMQEVFRTRLFAFLPYGKSWSKQRKLLSHDLSTVDNKQGQESESVKLVAGLAKGDGWWELQIDRYTASVIFSWSHGRRSELFSLPPLG